MVAMMIRVAVAAVAVAAILVAMKAVAYIVTDSIAMMASLADSALDVFASFVNLLAIRHALTPADREHRFGHGKAEPLAGLGQGAFIAGSAAFLVIEAVSRLIAPHPIEYPLVGLAVMAVSIVTTIALVIAQRIVVKRTGSIAVGADRMHYLGDIVTNVGVILGIILSAQFGILIADPIIGIVVAAILAWSAVHVFRQSYDQLMDRELPDADRDRIKEIVRAPSRGEEPARSAHPHGGGQHLHPAAHRTRSRHQAAPRARDQRCRRSRSYGRVPARRGDHSPGSGGRRNAGAAGGDLSVVRGTSTNGSR